MDKGLTDFLEGINISLKQTIATIAMGGDSPDVKLNYAIESCNTQKIKKILKSSTIARSLTDLIQENLSCEDSNSPERLKVTQAILDSTSSLDHDKEFAKGSRFMNTISKSNPSHAKLVEGQLNINNRQEKRLQHTELWGRGGPM